MSAATCYGGYGWISSLLVSGLGLRLQPRTKSGVEIEKEYTRKLNGGIHRCLLLPPMLHQATRAGTEEATATGSWGAPKQSSTAAGSATSTDAGD